MLRPLNDNVIIELIKEEKKTASGIMLTGESVTSVHKEGVVVAVGPGFNYANGDRKEMTVEVGDRVIYDVNHQKNVEYQGKKLLIMSEDNVLAIIEGEK